MLIHKSYTKTNPQQAFELCPPLPVCRDEEMDGEWEAPQIPNPACETAPGCGEWKRPMINNPQYKGKWKAPLVDNSNYQVMAAFDFLKFLYGSIKSNIDGDNWSDIYCSGFLCFGVVHPSHSCQCYISQECLEGIPSKWSRSRWPHKVCLCFSWIWYLKTASGKFFNSWSVVTWTQR